VQKQNTIIEDIVLSFIINTFVIMSLKQGRILRQRKNMMNL